VTLANGAYPDVRLLPEPDIADMQFFLEQIQLILPVLGVTLLQPTPSTQQLLAASESEDVSPLFEMNPVGTQATAREYHGEFIVLKGSTALVDGVASWTSYRQLREQLVLDRHLMLAADGKFYRFADDVAFKSPSAAAEVVFAGNQNGTLAWKVKDTMATYKEWKEAKLRQAGIGEMPSAE
jgi:hypothetical protein